MKYFLLIIVLCSSFVASPIFAAEEKYNDCLLEHLKNAKVNAATQMVKNACKENYGNVMFISKDKQAYNECLLEYLMGIESSDAANEIEKVCYDKHLKF